VLKNSVLYQASQRLTAAIAGWALHDEAASPADTNASS
jgi:hypothetical protein